MAAEGQGERPDPLAPLRERYARAAHAMQSGVAMEHGRGSQDGTPKHLRVGVNSALVNDAALARLLLAKGFITDAEYLEAVTVEMEDEVKRYETRLSNAVGAPITLR